MARRTLNRHELRAAAEAAEALGLNTPADCGARRPARIARSRLRSKPMAGPRMRIIWAVCDMGGRTVATFEYARKAEAEAPSLHSRARKRTPLPSSREGAHGLERRRSALLTARPWRLIQRLNGRQQSGLRSAGFDLGLNRRGGLPIARRTNHSAKDTTPRPSGWPRPSSSGPDSSLARRVRGGLHAPLGPWALRLGSLPDRPLPRSLCW